MNGHFEDPLFKSSEEQARERGPIFNFSRKEPGPDGEEVEKRYVSVFGIELDVRKDEEGGTIFKKEEFNRFSLDEVSQELLRTFATAVKLKQPALVEGETDIGKTKTLEFLSQLANTRLMRISCSGQTDISEFIGKFVPNHESKQETLQRILENEKALSSDSKKIVSDAQEEVRALTPQELETVASYEGIDLKGVQWIWQDGIIPQAMKWNKGEGCWLYFDELGAAEPQILVKLNRIFEARPRLELTEYTGEIVEGGQNFRVFATTNPPEYAGRLPFAPDFLRRFAYRKVGGLDEKALRARAQVLFRGETNVAGETALHYQENPLRFSERPEVSEIIEQALVEFHQAAQQALEGGLVKDQKQQFRFDFSDIVRVKEYLEALQSGDTAQDLKEAVMFYYSGKLLKADARKKLEEIFDQTMELFDVENKLKRLEGSQEPEHREAVHHIASREERVSDVEAESGPVFTFRETWHRGEPSFVATTKKDGNPVFIDKYSVDKPEIDVEYRVKIVKEVPGAVFVRLEGKSPRQILQEDMEARGFILQTNLRFDPGSSVDEIKENIFRETEELGIPARDEDVEVLGEAYSRDGQRLSGYVSVWALSGSPFAGYGYAPRY